MSKTRVGVVTKEREFAFGSESVSMDELEKIWSGKLESVFPTKADKVYPQPKTYSFSANKSERVSPRIARPRVLIPVFPGTNCEYDTGAQPYCGSRCGAGDFRRCNNLTAAAVARIGWMRSQMRMSRAQILFIPGGFSGGDEPDGSGKFITAFYPQSEDCRSNRRAAFGQTRRPDRPASATVSRR